jgi:hypothetical protein
VSTDSSVELCLKGKPIAVSFMLLSLYSRGKLSAVSIEQSCLGLSSLQDVVEEIMFVTSEKDIFILRYTFKICPIHMSQNKHSFMQVAYRDITSYLMGGKLYKCKI